MGKGRLLLVLATVALSASLVATRIARPQAASDRVSASAPLAPLMEARSKPFRWVGSGTCVGRSCHGALEPSLDAGEYGCLHNEFTTILMHDKHASAYQVLLQERSQRMVRLLGRDDGKAHEERRCLACHTTPQSVSHLGEASQADRLRAEHAFGIGCESCHGSASAWLNPHVAATWRTQPQTQFGMVPVRDLARQAERCAGCHVGSPPTEDCPEPRQVDHDLIAAGHPRLLFDFAAFRANMPPHWKPLKRTDAEAWYIGQVEGAMASLRLLQHRAETAENPWPELAEYDCFACHRGLGNSTASNTSRGNGRRPGSWSWNTWNGSTVPLLLGPQHDSLWRDLAAEMQKPRPNRADVGRRVTPVLARLQELSDQRGPWRDPTLAAKSFRKLLDDPRWASTPTWEGAEQYFFALQSWHETEATAELSKRLEALTRRRGLDPDHDSPTRFNATSFFPSPRK